MAVITISRELGSNGDLIADLLCEKLGYCRVDKDVLSQIAERAGVNIKAILKKEQDGSQKPRLISEQMTSLYGRAPSAFARKSELDDQTYARIVHETITRYANEGHAVIVGRGGQMILRDDPRALHIHLHAPPDVRAQRLVERLGISPLEAKRRIEQSDAQKRDYIRQWFDKANWKDVKYYHLAIDTERFPIEVVAEFIALAAQAIDKAQT
ncbi:MAG: cytidylate kinase-like family protein [Anaerolineae bacterium]|nr:cytidylate kinase-like family protein [Anaerolineae bacterium]